MSGYRYGGAAEHFLVPPPNTLQKLAAAKMGSAKGSINV